MTLLILAATAFLAVRYIPRAWNALQDASQARIDAMVDAALERALNEPLPDEAWDAPLPTYGPAHIDYLTDTLAGDIDAEWAELNGGAA